MTRIPAELKDFACLVETYVRDHRKVRDAFEDRVPDANVLDPLRSRATALSEVLEGVQADLDEVVDEREERSQGEGCHEHRHKPVLDHCHRSMHRISLVCYVAKPQKSMPCSSHLEKTLTIFTVKQILEVLVVTCF